MNGLGFSKKSGLCSCWGDGDGDGDDVDGLGVDVEQW